MEDGGRKGGRWTLHGFNRSVGNLWKWMEANRGTRQPSGPSTESTVAMAASLGGS